MGAKMLRHAALPRSGGRGPCHSTTGPRTPNGAQRSARRGPIRAARTARSGLRAYLAGKGGRVGAARARRLALVLRGVLRLSPEPHLVALALRAAEVGVFEHGGPVALGRDGQLALRTGLVLQPGHGLQLLEPHAVVLAEVSADDRDRKRKQDDAHVERDEAEAPAKRRRRIDVTVAHGGGCCKEPPERVGYVGERRHFPSVPGHVRPDVGPLGAATYSKYGVKLVPVDRIVLTFREDDARRGQHTSE
mmetsp:Transcript_110467/g.291673  ORF Transcript_110467/g.291673 Transcript_110467/m.291673 type:complete len:248 (+) Transcript_110467:336-1079(+)